MQPLLDGPRSGLTEKFVRDLLQSQSAIMFEYGAVGLDEDFNPVADLQSYMTPGSSITSDNLAKIHRTCTILLDGDVVNTWDYLSGYIKPWMKMVDVATGESAQFNLGVYTLTTPAISLATNPSVLSFTGYDLIQLLDQPVGDSYEVPVGEDPVIAAATAITIAIPGASVNYTASEVSLDAPVTFPLDAGAPTTWYEIITTLLDSVGYRQVWVDWEGVFRLEPFIDPQTESPEWVFNLTDDINIVAEDRAQDMDLFNVPNWFRFIKADLTAAAVEGDTMFTYEDTSAGNPSSTQNRGRLIRHIEQVTVTSYDALLEYAQKRINYLLESSEIFATHTQPFPLAWHLDILDYNDPNLGDIPPINQTQRRVVATGWTLPLDGLTDMDWTWQTITEQTVTDLLTSVTE